MTELNVPVYELLSAFYPRPECLSMSIPKACGSRAQNEQHDICKENLNSKGDKKWQHDKDISAFSCSVLAVKMLPCSWAPASNSTDMDVSNSDGLN